MSVPYTTIATHLVTQVTAAVGATNWKITKGRPASYTPPHIAVFGALSRIPTPEAQVVEENETWTVRIITTSSDEAEQQDDAMTALRAIVDYWFANMAAVQLSGSVQEVWPTIWTAVEFSAGETTYPGFDLTFRVVDKYTTSY